MRIHLYGVGLFDIKRASGYYFIQNYIDVASKLFKIFKSTL